MVGNKIVCCLVSFYFLLLPLTVAFAGPWVSIDEQAPRSPSSSSSTSSPSSMSGLSLINRKASYRPGQAEFIYPINIVSNSLDCHTCILPVLTYSSAADVGLAGIGWDLLLPSLIRNGSDLWLNWFGQKEKLSQINSTSFRTRFGQRIENQNGVYRILNLDGLEIQFGTPYNNTDGSQIYLPNTIRNSFGVQTEYVSLPNIPVISAIKIDRVAGNYQAQIDFAYQSSPRTNNLLISSVALSKNGTLISRKDFEYYNGLSEDLLSKINARGSDDVIYTGVDFSYADYGQSQLLSQIKNRIGGEIAISYEQGIVLSSTPNTGVFMPETISLNGGNGSIDSSLRYLGCRLNSTNTVECDSVEYSAPTGEKLTNDYFRDLDWRRDLVRVTQRFAPSGTLLEKLQYTFNQIDGATVPEYSVAQIFSPNGGQRILASKGIWETTGSGGARLIESKNLGEIDSFNNGNVIDSYTNDNVSTLIGYVSDDPAKRLYDRPKKIEAVSFQGTSLSVIDFEYSRNAGTLSSIKHKVLGEPNTTPTTRTSSFTWDSFGRLSKWIDSTGVESQFVGYGNSLVPAGQVLDPAASNFIYSFERDSLGRLTAVTSPDGVKNSIQRDAFGRLIRHSVISGQTEKPLADISYSFLGMNSGISNNIVSVNQNGKYNRLYFDGFTQPLQLEKSTATTKSSIVRLGYDSSGRFDWATLPFFEPQSGFSTSPGKQSLRLQFDTDSGELSRLVPAINGDGYGNIDLSYGWNSLPESLQISDSKGGISEIALLNSSIEYASGKNAERTSFVDSIAFDARQITSKNQANNTISSTFNSAGELLTDMNWNGQVYSYTYDAAGRITSRKDAMGNIIVLGYDKLGRLISERSFSSGSQTPDRFVLTKYDQPSQPGLYVAKGWVSSKETENDLVRYHYNHFGEVEAFFQTDKRDGRIYEFRIKNGVHGPDWVEVPHPSNSPVRIDWSYDSNGAEKDITILAASELFENGILRKIDPSSRNSFGYLTKMELWDGLELHHDYSDSGVLKEMTVKQNDKIRYKIGYDYDERDLIGVTESIGDSSNRTTSFKYKDSRGYLTSTQVTESPGSVEMYDTKYDQLGRIVQDKLKLPSGEPYKFEYKSSQSPYLASSLIASSGDYPIVRDGMGRKLSVDAPGYRREFKYYSDGKLKEIKNNQTGGTLLYEYGVFGLMRLQDKSEARQRTITTLGNSLLRRVEASDLQDYEEIIVPGESAYGQIQPIGLLRTFLEPIQVGLIGTDQSARAQMNGDILTDVASPMDKGEEDELFGEFIYLGEPGGDGKKKKKKRRPYPPNPCDSLSPVLSDLPSCIYPTDSGGYASDIISVQVNIDGETVDAYFRYHPDTDSWTSVPASYFFVMDQSRMPAGWIKDPTPLDGIISEQDFKIIHSNWGTYINGSNVVADTLAAMGSGSLYNSLFMVQVGAQNFSLPQDVKNSLFEMGQFMFFTALDFLSAGIATPMRASMIVHTGTSRALAPSYHGLVLGSQAAESALNRALARLIGLRIGSKPVVTDIKAFGSRAGSMFRGRGPTATSDLDLAISIDSRMVTMRGNAWEVGGRSNAWVWKTLRQIAADFEKQAGYKLSIHPAGTKVGTGTVGDAAKLVLFRRGPM